MFNYIEGRLAEITPTYAVIDCGGVGYIINISLHTFSKLPNNITINDKPFNCKLLTHLLVREDAHILFGFFDKEERILFRHLISVSGVGANTARMILSSLSPAEVVNAILLDDVVKLKSIKGIGAKTAQRIILDLTDKLEKTDFSSEKIAISHNTKKDEALSALIMLGFAKNVGEKAVNKIIQQKGLSMSVEELIKEALQML